MSKLKELIDRLCPDGVEYKPLGEVAKIMNGKDYKHLDNGDIPVYGSGGVMTYINDFMFDGESVLLPRKGSIGKLYYVNDKFWTVDTIYWTKINPDILKPKFLYYFLQTQNIEGKAIKAGAVPSMTQAIYNKIPIPVPPIEVQEEIVKILDRFADYAAELQAELQARKEQYEYYRNLLLTFNPSACGCGTDGEQEIKITAWGGHSYEITWKTMGEIFIMKAGKSIPSSNISGYNPGNYFACYGANGLRGYVDKANRQTDNVLIGRQGALCGNVCFANGPYYATDHAVVIENSSLFNNRFLFHLLTNANLNQYKTAGAQPGLSVEILRKIVIPVPPLELQEKIVAILDRFETLVNDLTQGLPAEIAAVKEQYEYYRNKLLTFKPLSA